MLLGTVGRGLTVVAFLGAGALAFAAPPPPVTGLTASATVPGQVALAWTPSAGATSYRVYRSFDQVLSFLPVPPAWTLDPSAVLTATVTAPNHIDFGLPPLVRQYYAVSAVNADGESTFGFPLPAMALVRTIAPANAPIFGMADLHNHAFANVAFGGELVWGKTWDPRGPDFALPGCTPAHGLGGLDDIIGNYLGNHFPGHATGGWDQFDGWPAWNSYTHQQVYYEWLKRAYDGGLRLVVVPAVNNVLLCTINGQAAGSSCDDMTTVDAQLDAAKQLEAYIGGLPGGGWLKIAYSGTEARQIINSGKLAVVLGVEVDTLFGCRVGGTCDDAFVRTKLDEYYAKGVRHVFPVHVFDNAFGGTALYNDLFDYGNRLTNGSFVSKRECAAEGFAYKAAPPNGLVSVVAGILGIGNPAPNSYVAECNARGLSPLGETLVREMMGRGMIVDIDHMSALAVERTLQIAEAAQYPAIVAGHTGLVDLSLGHLRAESGKTVAQTQRVSALGGLVTPHLNQGSTDETAQEASQSVTNDCSNSSKTWAQTYLAMVTAMGGSGSAVAFGSDFNGLAGEPGPRFGSFACPGDNPRTPQTGGVAYPFPIHGPNGSFVGHLGLSSLGRRSWNFNLDGMAHVGMLPDFVQDLKTAGLTPAQLDPLFRSAEAYIAMWEKAQRAGAPTVAGSVSPAPNAAGWHRTDPTVTMTGTPSPIGRPVARIVYSAAGAQPDPGAVVEGTSATVAITAEGTTSLYFTAEDDTGRRSPTGVLTVGLDKTAPTAQCDAPDGLWHPTDVRLACAATDVVSGVVGDGYFDLATAVAMGAETAAAATGSLPLADAAGNTSTAGPIGGIKIDKKAPSVTLTAPTATTYTIGRQVAASFLCSDGGSGVVTCTGTAPNGSPIDTSTPGARTFAVDATDGVANRAMASVSYNVGYGVCPVFVPHWWPRGGPLGIMLRLCDASGRNLSTASVPLTLTGFTRMGPLGADAGAQVVGPEPPEPEGLGRWRTRDGQFVYLRRPRAYALWLRTRGLDRGQWRIDFTAGSDPTTHSVLVRLF
jgi:microsomal dipeptidase-like Zn-dependent dipeptidase